MENFLPALLIIAGVIYKIYTEFQKEQEKARQRMPRQGNPPPPTYPVPSGQQYPPQPIVIEPTVTTPIPVPEPPKKVAYVPDVPKEVLQARTRRIEEDKRRKDLKAVEDLERETEEAPEFDLREAVIQSAVLNRPYQ